MIRSGDHALFDAYQATGPRRSFLALPLTGRWARAIEQIGIAAQASAVTVAQALVRMNRAFEVSANRSRHNPRKTP